MKYNKPLLTLLITILIFEALLTGLLPVIRGHLFSLLTLKSGAIYLAIFYYFLNYMGIDFFQSIKAYIVLKLALWYRTLRTKSVIVDITSWYASSSVGIRVRVSDITKEVTNCPQRIQEDIKLSYLSRITVWSEYFVSGIILMQLILLNLDVPTLIAGALIYAVISLGIAYLFNSRLTQVEIDAQQAEATYRTSLVERLTDLTFLPQSNQALISAGLTRTKYLLFTKLQLGIVAVLPYIVLLPSLLNGSMDLGKLVEHQSTFALIVINASVLIQLYTLYIQGTASEKRVKELEK